MFTQLKEFLDSRELLLTWTMRDFRVRYSQSVLGAAWAILQPFSLMVIFSLVFSVFIKIPTGGVAYPIFAYTALLPWTFFASALSAAIPSLVEHLDIVSKIYFPREILPFSAILVASVDFGIAALVYALMLVFYRVAIGPLALIALLALLIQLLLTFGISLVGAAVNVFYRDIRFVIPLMLHLWFYLSPVIYPVELVPERFQPLYFLNPMAAIIETYRRTLLFNQPPDWPYLGLAALVSLAVLLLGYRYFKRVEREFADAI